MNINLFRSEIAKAGMTQSELAVRIGMAPSTLYRKIKADKFGTDEVKRIAYVLNIENPVPIFFDK